ncbi:MAG: HNH endonuclease [Planctomycetota bacterium]
MPCISAGIHKGNVFVSAEGLNVVVSKSLSRAIKRIEAGTFNGGFPAMLTRVQKLSKSLALQVGDEGVRLLKKHRLVVKFHKPGKTTTNISLVDDSGNLLFRGTDEEIVFYLVRKLEQLEDPIKFKNGFSRIVNGLPKFNKSGEALRNSSITDLVPSARGLAPDFSKTPHYLFDSSRSIQKIVLTGSRDADFRLANKLAGLGRTPKGYTWHHLDDLNELTGECTMQLVKTKPHSKASHSGGATLWARIFEVTYKN